jgi:integrase
MATERVGVYYDPRKKHPWIVRWFGEFEPTTAERHRYSKGFRLKRDAERFQAEKQAEFEKGALRDKPREVTLGEFCDLYLERRRGEWRSTTRGNHEDLVNRLGRFFGREVPLRRLRPEDAHRFWVEAKPSRKDLADRTLAKDTRNRILREARTLFEYAKRWEYIAQNPFAGLKQQRVTRRDRKDWRYITPAEYQALLQAAPTLRWKAFYAISYTAGLRFGEAVNLTAANVDLRGRSVFVRSRPATDELPPFEVKDHEDRPVPIPDSTVETLRELLEAGDPDCPFILLTPARNRSVLVRWKSFRLAGRSWENRCMMNNTLREFQRHAKRAGISGHDSLTVHTLRKSCGQNWANHLPIHVTQAYMGHADISTTQQFYLKVCEEHADRARWVIEQVTTLAAGTTDAGMTPEAKNAQIRQAG